MGHVRLLLMWKERSQPAGMTPLTGGLRFSPVSLCQSCQTWLRDKMCQSCQTVLGAEIYQNVFECCLW